MLGAATKSDRPQHGWATLATLAWMERRRNLILTGESRSGRTHLACGLAAEAVRRGWTARYVHYLLLLKQCETTHRRGEVDLFTQEVTRPALLVIEEFAFD